MTFGEKGFLSPTMEHFRSSLRAIPAYAQWFQFAEEINQFSLDLLWDHDVPTTDTQKITTCALFVRAQQSFQAAIRLSELGMLSDARVVLRSAVEGTIALHSLENDGSFIDKLIEAHMLHQRKMARLILENPAYRSSHTADQINKMESTIADIDSAELKAGRKFRDINWEQSAEHCRDLYNLLYRILSSDGTHTNISAIHRFLQFDRDDNLKNMRVGPDTTDLVEVLRMACLMLLWATDPFIRIFEKTDHKARWSMYRKKYDHLPHTEPDNVFVQGIPE